MTAPVRILYVDDDAGLGVLLSRALTPHGITVEAVENGEEALARLQADRFDAVALDHNLTNEVGLDLIPRIRALPQAPPIIYVTGSEDVRIAVAALKAGAVDYVWKDVAGHYRELLRQAIATAVEQEKLKREREEAQRQIAAARDRAELLLKEVNHRVANSLAIVSSFIQMQAHAIADPAAREMMRETKARVAAIAGVHKRLYTSADVRVVEVNAYLSSLVEELAASLNLEGQRLVFIAAEREVTLATDKAVSLGVVITELLTNAVKYAYADKAGGEIRVRVAALAGGELEVAVEDDGVGWSGQGDIKGTGLGTRIITAMSQSLQARLGYEPACPGTRAVLRIAP
jgi:two-component sensor histidine kinase/CheY-like chemotaxis protein